MSIFSTDRLISGLILHAVLAVGVSGLPEGAFGALPANTAPLLLLTAFRAEDFLVTTFLLIFLAAFLPFLVAFFAVLFPADFFACFTVTFRAGFVMRFVFARFVFLALLGTVPAPELPTNSSNETTQELYRIDAGQTTNGRIDLTKTS